MTKTPFIDWYNSIPKKDKDARLTTLLAKYQRPFEFVEDIDEEKFMNLHNAGKKSWLVLSKLIDKYHNQPPYSQAQKNRTLKFVREIETLVQSWNANEREPDRDQWYEKSRDVIVEDYLTEILKQPQQR